MKKLLFFAFILALPFSSEAQRWKKARYDLILGLGSTTFLGELGGANQIGTHFARDLEWSQTRPCGTIGFRYRWTEYLAWRGNISYGRLKGDDKKTAEVFRNNRNLSFASNVYELSVSLEAALMREQVGHRYRLRGVRGTRGYEIYLYFFGGFGVFHHNPKAKIDGAYVALQPLHTEGQGLVPTRTPYKRVQICIPGGLGLKYAISKRLMLGLEFGVRYTFTDYLDDVSTTYVSPAILSQQARGEQSVQLANRASEGPGTLPPGIYEPGQQRGNPKYKDAFVFTMLTLNYKLQDTRGHWPKF